MSDNDFMFLPPWTERGLDGKPGREYGPRTQHGYQRAWTDWNESIWGGGLWDHDEDKHGAGRMPVYECGSPERYDAKDMARFMTACSHDVSERELEVYVWYWKEGMSIAATSRSMGMTERAVYGHIKRLRRRMKHYTARRR